MREIIYFIKIAFSWKILLKMGRAFENTVGDKTQI
jgi:hypothetical protein